MSSTNSTNQQSNNKLVRLQVISQGEATDTADNTAVYSISVAFEDHSFQVKKSSEQCCKFLLELKNEFFLSGKQHPLVETTDESLTFEYFQSFISLSSVALDNILASKAWLSFLDNQKDVSVMTLIHIRILESKISAMTEKLQLYDSRLVQLEIDSMSLKSIVNPGSNTFPVVGSKSGSSNSEYESVFIEHKDRANEIKSSTAPSTMDGADYAIEGTTPAGGNIFAMEEVDYMLPDDNILQQVLIPVISDVYPLSVDDECLQYFNAEADILLQSIQPHESQLQYRKSAARFLKRHIRSALGVMSYEYDFQGINCFLPADVLKISIVLSQSQSPYWFTSVAEKLKESAEGIQQPLSSRLPDGVEDDDSDLGPTLQHMVRNVNVISEHETSKIICVLDASLEVEITTNARLDTCFYLFLNEFNILVGKDNLFKRTMLLIRCWWFYETATYANTPIRHYLSDTTLGIMLVTIFNIYHQQINSVFEAFVYFLRDFSQYDGKSYAISIQGIIGFLNEASNQPCMVRPQPNQLITLEIMDKFWEIFNIHESSEFEGNTSGLLVRPPAFQHAKLRQHMLLQSMQKASTRFERYGFNVIHPFLGVNTVTEKLSSRRLSLISRVFQLGYATLSTVIEQAKLDANTTAELFRGYLPSVYSRFSNQWRPDAVKNSILLSNGAEFASGSNCNDLMTIVSDKLWQSVYYCNFIAESIISESALLTFCVDTLTYKGPLPAGELGKLLSEASSILNLSHKLREKFGGLKKFLERYPDIFVFSNDHPFNPHVLLRATISQENLELIDRGIFPVHLISKSVKTNAAKKPKSSTMISTSSLPAALYTPESQHMGGGMENGNMAGSMQYGYMANKPPTPTSNFGASSRTNIPQRGQQMLPSHHHHQQQLAYSNNYNVGSANNNFHGYAGEQQRAAALHAMNGSNHPQPHPNLYVQPSRHKAVDFHGQQLHSATNNNPYTAAMNNSSFNGGYRGNNPPFPGVDSRALGGGIHQELGINDQGRSAAGVNHFESHYNSGTSAAPGLSRRKSPLDALDFSSSDAFSGSVPINPYANNAQTQLNVFSSLRSVGGSSSGNHEFADFNMNTADYLLDSQSSSNQLVGDNSSRYGGSMKGSNPFSIHDGLSQSSMSTMDDMNLGTIRNDSQQTRSTAEFDELSTNTPDSGNNMQSFSSYQYHRF